MTPPAEFDRDLTRAIERVWALLEQIGRRTTDAPGITRPAWGRRKNSRPTRSATSPAAGPAGAARSLRQYQHADARTGPFCTAVTSGSHLDSVPHGGNYDGLAGVAAGSRSWRPRRQPLNIAAASDRDAVRGKPLVRHSVSGQPANAWDLDARRHRWDGAFRQRQDAAAERSRRLAIRGAASRSRRCSIGATSRISLSCISSRVRC